MKIGFLFKKQQEMEQMKREQELVQKTRSSLKENADTESDSSNVQQKKIKANLEALKK